MGQDSVRHTCQNRRIVIKRILLILLSSAILTYVVVSLAADFKNISYNAPTEEDARIFCWQGRVFVEFNNGRNTWGVQMLNSEGQPIRCPKKSQVES